MVERARRRGLYHDLQVGELVQCLQQYGAGEPQLLQGEGPAQHRPALDLLVAADVFVYLGDLRPVLGAAAAAATSEWVSPAPALVAGPAWLP
jgi:predicted TPR repeat methyltransferase